MNKLKEKECKNPTVSPKSSNQIIMYFVAPIMLVVGLIFCAVVAILIKDVNVRATSAALKECVICIDPGHGFNDPGAEGHYIGQNCEADINLSVAKKLGSHLSELGYSVYYTHDGDILPDDCDVNNDGVFNPNERVIFSDILQSEIDKPMIFVSIHCDSFTNDESVNGTRLYYQTSNDNTTKNLVDSVLKTLANNNGTRRAPLAKSMDEESAYTVICNRGKINAFLIECGFITNINDGNLLTDDEWQNEFADSIAEGIHNFCR